MRKKCRKHNVVYKKQCPVCYREQLWITKYAKKQAQEIFSPRLSEDVLKYGALKISLKKGVFLYGLANTQKTTIIGRNLFWIMYQKFIYNQVNSFHFVTAPDLIAKLQNAYATKQNIESIFQYYCRVDYLVLDDIGTEKLTDWVLQSIFRILNYRYEYFKWTSFTSNISNIEDDFYGEQRITHRIKELAKFIYIQ